MPMFYMMVGLPGSGKSFTAESIPNAVVHSSDAIRAEVLGDENDQTQQDLVFQTLHKRVLQDLVDGKDVVYDATNINYKRRIGFLDRVRALHKHDLRTVCLFMATPYEVCLERNNNRERSVPESVIQKMYFKFDVPMMAEGWDEIRIVGDEDRHDQIDTLMLRLSKLEHDNPHHEYTVGQHSMTAWQYLISHYKGADAALLRATLLHDIGKEKTKVFHDIKGNPTEIAHFYHHERVGAYDSFCYTLVLTDYATIQTDAWFGYNIQKMCSVSASMATLAFNKAFNKEVVQFFLRNDIEDAQRNGDTSDRALASAILYANYDASLKRGAMFDSRAFSVPKEEVCNCLIWRQQDATRNSIEAVGQANFSHHELHKKTCNMIQEMLWSQRGINWNDFPTELKRGSCCIKRRFEETIDDPRNPGQKITVCRNRWIIDHEIPIFTQDREYLERLI